MAQLSRRIVLNAVFNANGKKSAQEIALEIGCEKQNVTSHVNSFKIGVKNLETIVQGNPNQMMDSDEGKVLVSASLDKIYKKWGNNLERIKMNDTRGRKKMSLNEAFCLDDLEL